MDVFQARNKCGCSKDMSHSEDIDMVLMFRRLLKDKLREIVEDKHTRELVRKFSGWSNNPYADKKAFPK